MLSVISTNGMDCDMACSLDFYFRFYDQWVSRDLNGNWLSSLFPFFKEKIAQDSLVKKLPIRVFSCWNGITVVEAEPFMMKHVKFRVAKGKEKYGSESFFVAKDLIVLGRDLILINPNAMVAYDRFCYLFQHFVMVPFVNPFLKKWRVDWFHRANTSKLDSFSKNLMRGALKNQSEWELYN